MKTMFTLLLALVFTYSNAQNLPEVFSAININLKEDHSSTEFANFMGQLNEGMQHFGKGIGMWASYGDRGDRKGKFAYGFAFELKENRDYYFPTADAEGENAYPQITALIAEMNQAGYSTNSELFEEDGGYTDYVCVGYDALINPKIGGLVGVRPFPVKKGSEEAFEKFVASELYPAYDKNIDGVHLFVYKGDRGQGKDSYIVLMSFKSVELRNSFFPSEGSNGTDAFSTEFSKVQAVMEKFNGFGEKTYVENPYTDYVGIKL
ncbi:MAG TPA: hypothetical protein PK066_07055 [Saprospiraceae bacterium]|nr:hypothetical protein [Saprospiraceae bacterium]